ALAGCGGGGTDVGVTLRDFEIALDSTSAEAGEVTFQVANEGPSIHEFVVLKTDLAEDQLPADENGDVDEAGAPGIEVVDEIEDIEADATPSLAVELEAGSYVIICNLPGHYGNGMYTSFTVS
ncbi:MAG: cupredoxin domain-containing protein, partial [Actinomycetota bacterium]